MLNKELLMVGEGAPEGSIVMTVGEYNNIYMGTAHACMGV